MILFETRDSRSLLTKFENDIRDGHITTWDRSASGYFGHVAQRWVHKAFFAPSHTSSGLRFELTIVVDNVPLHERRAVFAFYHGHLLETFTNHFFGSYGQAAATPNPAGGETKI